MTLCPGMVLETAVWVTGKEPEGLQDRFEHDLRQHLATVADDAGVIIGPLILTEMRPGEERVPKVPDYIQGPDVRLLVVEATVVGNAHENEGAFVADLAPNDLERLRSILRRVHQAYNPGKPEITTEKCDEYINQHGPDAALEALREQVGVTIN